MYKTGKNGNNEIYVVGCGPSLKGFRWPLLENKTTISVNGAIRDVPNPDWLVTADSRFARMASVCDFWDVQTYKVLVMGTDHKRYMSVQQYLHLWDRRITPRRFDGQIGFSEDEFCTGQNSGFCGIQLAVILGARKIHLLGMDFHTEGGENYHDLYSSDPRRLDEFLTHFRTAVEILKGRDIEVVSHSPSSLLNDMIPFEPLKG